jgi:hypothetical protein
MEQKIAYSFDKETKKSILKSLGLSILAAGGAFISSYQTTANVRSSLIIAASTGGAFLVNIIIEYVKGV